MWDLAHEYDKQEILNSASNYSLVTLPNKKANKVGPRFTSNEHCSLPML